MNNSITEKLKGMPTTVRWSVFLSTLALVISIITQVANWKTITARPDDYFTENQIIFGYTLGMLIAFGMIVFTALGKNWMRYVLIATYAMAAFRLIYDFQNQMAQLASVYPALQNLLGWASFILLFTPSANKWFKRKPSVVG